MLIALTEYAKIHSKSADTLRRLAERGALRTAQKIGRNWAVDSSEEYPVRKRSAKKEIIPSWRLLFLFFRGAAEWI